MFIFGGPGGQVVSVVAFYYNDLRYSTNAEVYNYNCVKNRLKRTKIS